VEEGRKWFVNKMGGEKKKLGLTRKKQQPEWTWVTSAGEEPKKPMRPLFDRKKSVEWGKKEASRKKFVKKIFPPTRGRGAAAGLLKRKDVKLGWKKESAPVQVKLRYLTNRGERKKRKGQVDWAMGHGSGQERV